ncbi:MBL fold metallo-hydrolase [Spirosoma fluviale]|uniref:L-ascorbate metabolism protein UlaG, beta-lactamase superfamily n=1 Tax=Spirosoma fluviale TaxID=1597977 RepID=A0A286GGP3_9BACT|nr:MBL fold metallo-hydrolase [Spirosoma fluviale]SOD94705.1 L-ascorbate metabolism protein UlaG, beta-lactamase superfamily [Spirosoma fluviale]
MLKPAFQKDNVLLADMESATSQSDTLHIWWLGQSGFLLRHNDNQLLFDPYLSDSLSRKYADTDKPHVRISELVIEPGRLKGVDVVTSSHNHTDHLDTETLLPLIAANPGLAFVIPEANRAFIADRLKTSPDWPIGMNDGQTVSVGPFVFHGVPAAHNELERDAEGRCKFMGFVVELGGYRVYHSGDTLWYDGMEEVLRPFQVDVAFLPINGNKPERRVAGNLNPDEAARLGRDIGAKLVIPHHYDLFEFNTADPADFVNACEQYGTTYRVMQLGERISLSR